MKDLAGVWLGQYPAEIRTTQLFKLFAKTTESIFDVAVGESGSTTMALTQVQYDLKRSYQLN